MTELGKNIIYLIMTGVLMFLTHLFTQDVVYTENMKSCLDEGGTYRLNIGDGVIDYEYCEISRKIYY